MRVIGAGYATCLVAVFSSVAVAGQSPQPAPAVSVPRLVHLTGIFRPADGQPPAPVEAITVAIYAEETGGAPLWQETQSIDVDPAGNYMLLLGATERDGVPLDVVALRDARWLGWVWARPGEVEGPRIRLTSVFYALQASNADTLGGKPASAYLLSAAAGGEGSASDRPESPAKAEPALENPIVNAGSTNFLAKYVNVNDVGTSSVYDPGGRIGINTTAPLDVVHASFTSTTGGLTGLAVQNLGNTTASYSGMLFYDQFGALGQFQGFNNVTHEYRINNIASNGTINFMTGSASRFLVTNNGNIGIGTATPSAKLHVAGGVMVDGNIGAKYQDVAEWVESTEQLEPGTIVVIDSSSKDRVRAATAAYDVAVAGAVSAQPGVMLGEPGAGKILVAQSGRVRIKADARYGAIRAGDLVVTSRTKGHAMRSTPVRVGGTQLHRPGTVLGKALEPLAKGTGEILVLLTLQ